MSLKQSPLSQRVPAALPDLPSIVRRTDPRAAALSTRGLGPGEFASGFKPAVLGPPGKVSG